MSPMILTSAAPAAAMPHRRMSEATASARMSS
jgi:hypothetical protein